MLAPDALIAAGCAVAYPMAMLLIKRSYQQGVHPYQHLLLGTVIQALVFAILLPFAEFPDDPALLVLPLAGIGTFLAATAVFLLGWSKPRHAGHLVQGILYALASAASFALSDILIVRGADDLDPRALVWLVPGAILFSVQAAGFGLSLAVWQNPSLVNIVYSPRGIWSVILVLLVGRSIGVPEGTLTRGVAAARASGAALMIAVVTILLV